MELIATTEVPLTMSSAFSFSDEEVMTNPNYHPAICGPDESFLGKTWRDMSGSDDLNKKMNFFLFRRGLYEPTVKDGRKDISRIFAGSRSNQRKAQ